MKAGLKFIGMIGVLIVAAGVAAVVALQSLDFNSFKDTLAAEVKAATGRDITLIGDINLSVSLQPSLRLENATFANAPWGSRPEMAKLDLLEARVALVPLLTGDIEVEYLRLTGLDLLLESNANGQANWDLSTGKAAAQPKAGAAGAFPLPRIHDVRLRDIRIAYVGGAGKEAVTLNIPAMDLAVRSADDSLKANIRAEFNGVPLGVDAELGSLNQLLRGSGAAFPVKLAITANGLAANLSGSVKMAETTPSFAFEAMLKTNDLATLSRLAAVTLPPVKQMDAKASISGSGTNIKMDAIQAKLGESDFSGAVRLNLGGARPSISAGLQSASLNLNEITGKQPKQDPAPPRDRVFSDEPLPFAALRAVDVAVNYNATAIKADALQLNNLKSEIRLVGGKLTVDPLAVGVGDGSLKAAINIDASTATPKVAINLTSRGLEVVRLLKELGYHDYLTLKLNSDINVSGSGASVRAIMAGLNGKVAMVGENGRINSRLLKNVSAGLGNIMPWAMNEDTNAINCVVLDFPIVDGVATGRTLLLDTNGMSVVGRGEARLGDEKLAFDINPEAKNASLASFAVPMRVSGTFAKPDVGINPVAAAISTVGNATNLLGKGAGGLGGLLLGLGGGPQAQQQNSPCVQALGGGANPAAGSPSQPAPPPAQPAGPAEKALEGVKDVTKGIGGAIKGIFGN